MRRLKAAVAIGTPEQAAHFREQVNTLLAPLRRIAQRELAYLQARGDLASDYPTLADVIDETLARAFQRVRENPGMSDLPVQEIATRLDTDEATVHRWLDYADAFLRARLEALGAVPASEASPQRPIGYVVPSAAAGQRKTAQ